MWKPFNLNDNQQTTCQLVVIPSSAACRKAVLWMPKFMSISVSTFTCRYTQFNQVHKHNNLHVHRQRSEVGYKKLLVLGGHDSCIVENSVAVEFILKW